MISNLSIKVKLALFLFYSHAVIVCKTMSCRPLARYDYCVFTGTHTHIHRHTLSAFCYAIRSRSFYPVLMPVRLNPDLQPCAPVPSHFNTVLYQYITVHTYTERSIYISHFTSTCVSERTNEGFREFFSESAIARRANKEKEKRANENTFQAAAIFLGFDS